MVSFSMYWIVARSGRSVIFVNTQHCHYFAMKPEDLRESNQKFSSKESSGVEKRSFLHATGLPKRRQLLRESVFEHGTSVGQSEHCDVAGANNRASLFLVYFTALAFNFNADELVYFYASRGFMIRLGESRSNLLITRRGLPSGEFLLHHSGK